LQKIDVSVQKEQVSNLLEDIRSKIPQCTIDSLVFNSQDELYVSLFESFLEGLTVNKSCLDVYTEWDLAFDTIKRLGLKSAKMCANRSMEDAVDGLILYKNDYIQVNDPVGIALSILSKRCFHLELEAACLTENEINRLARELPLLGKKVYFYAKVDKGAQKRNFVTGSMNVDIIIEQSTGEVEMWYDGMRRRKI
ncbi:hypothetical protein PENTCL1PPCAC_1304, partial [Pristionchus entomophagus]